MRVCIVYVGRALCNYNAAQGDSKVAEWMSVSAENDAGKMQSSNASVIWLTE